MQTSQNAVAVTDFNFDDLLRESVKIYGHVCPGEVLGVRMSILGLRAIGIDDPKVQTGKG